MTDMPTIPEGFTPHAAGPCPVHPETVAIELKPIDQTVVGLGNPRANCFQACLAMILGRPLSDCLDITDPTIDDDWVAQLNQWAAGLGLQMHSGITPPAGIPYIANGPTENREGVHGVVCANGKMFHDPHPSRDGLASINFYIWFQPYVEPTDWQAIAGELAGALYQCFRSSRDDARESHPDWAEHIADIHRESDQALAKYNAAKDKT